MRYLVNNSSWCFLSCPNYVTGCWICFFCLLTTPLRLMMPNQLLIHKIRSRGHPWISTWEGEKKKADLFFLKINLLRFIIKCVSKVYYVLTVTGSKWKAKILVTFIKRWVPDDRWSGCVKAGGVVTKLRPKMSTAVSIGNSWWEERFLIDLFLKLVCSSGRTQRVLGTIFADCIDVCLEKTSGWFWSEAGAEYVTSGSNEMKV